MEFMQHTLTINALFLIISIMKTNSDIKAAADKISSEYRPQRIILFGSHARGTADKWSDIDLLIIKQTKDRYFDRVKKVRKAIPGLPADILVYTPNELEKSKNTFFMQEVLEEGKTLYERK